MKRFVEEGGTIVAFGGSAVLGHHLGLPVSDHLVEVQQDGSERPLPGTKYYIPGSVLRVAVDNTNPLAYGMDKQVDVFFDNSPVLELAPDASMRGVKTVAWFDSRAPLRSGWAWGQHYLEGGAAAIEAARRQGQGVAVRTGDHVPRAAARHVQVPVQQHLLRIGCARGRHRARDDAAVASGVPRFRGCGASGAPRFRGAWVLGSSVSPFLGSEEPRNSANPEPGTPYPPYEP